MNWANIIAILCTCMSSKTCNQQKVRNAGFQTGTHFTFFLEENNLITVVQSGFWRMHSRWWLRTSLINITDKWWLRNIDQGLNKTGIGFIDLYKAFDTVKFEILLKKLKYYGVFDVELLMVHTISPYYFWE